MYEPFKKIEDKNNIFKNDKNFDIRGVDMCRIGPDIQIIKDIEINFKGSFIKIHYKNDYFIAALLVFFFISEQEQKCTLETYTDFLEWDSNDIEKEENAKILTTILKKNKEIFIHCGDENRAYHQCVLIFQVESGIPETYYYKQALKNWE